MANLITIGRLLLVFVVIALVYYGDVTTITICIPVVALIFAADGLDGYVARRRKSTSQFGSIFDIAGDRIVENALWIAFSNLGLITVAAPLLVMTRGFVVDGIRSVSYAEGKTAFGKENMMRSDFTRWLTAGRFMRGLYGYAKALGFVFLTGLQGYEHHDTHGKVLGSVYGSGVVRGLGWTCVWGALALTIVRGLPVIFDAATLWSRPHPIPSEQTKP